MGDSFNTNPINCFFSFVLGFIAISAAFIVFNQTSVHVGSDHSVALLLSMFCGLFSGFLLTHFYKDFLQKQLKYLFLLTAVWFSFFLSTLYFHYIGTLFTVFLMTSPFILFLFLGVLLALLLTQNHAKQAILLTLFMLGLLVAMIVTEWIILPFFGSSWAIFLDCCLILLCVLMLMKNFIVEIITTSLVVAVLVIAFGVNIQLNSNSIFAKDYLAINNTHYPIAPAEVGGNPSNAPEGQQNQYPYVPLIEKILYQDLKLTDQNVLVIGKGIYQFVQNDHTKVHFTYLNDADDSLPSACTYLDVVAKGNSILSPKDRPLTAPMQDYSVIIANIFPNNIAIPADLLSYQHLLEIRNALPENGTAIFNVLARPTLADSYSKRTDNTIRAVFPNCMEIPLVYGNEPTNIIYVCHKSIEEKDNRIYSSTIF